MQVPCEKEKRASTGLIDYPSVIGRTKHCQHFSPSRWDAHACGLVPHPHLAAPCTLRSAHSLWMMTHVLTMAFGARELLFFIFRCAHRANKCPIQGRRRRRSIDAVGFILSLLPRTFSPYFLGTFCTNEVSATAFLSSLNPSWPHNRSLMH